MDPNNQPTPTPTQPPASPDQSPTPEQVYTPSSPAPASQQPEFTPNPQPFVPVQSQQPQPVTSFAPVASTPVVDNLAFAPVEPAKSTDSGVEPRNFLVTFLIACMFGILGLRHFYLGEKKLGFIRLALLIGGYILAIIGGVTGIYALGILGAIAVFIAYIWALVDFFIVYSHVKTDADGRALTATARDKKWAKTIFWATIGFFIAYIIFIVVLFALAQSQQKQFEDTISPSSSELRYQSN